MIMTEDKADLREGFRAYLREGHFLSIESQLVPLAVAIYRRLGTGQSVECVQLAGDLNQSVEKTNTLLGEFSVSTVDYGPDGAIVAFRGLSLAPANHVFTTDGVDLYTWCVFDALFLPEILGKPATCVTRCPTTGTQIEIVLGPTSIVSSHPPEPVMSIVAPNQAACCDNLRGAFCNHVNFFVDEDAFRAWAADRSDVASVSLQDAHDLARKANQHRYGDHLRASATARTRDQE